MHTTSLQRGSATAIIGGLVGIGILLGAWFYLQGNSPMVLEQNDAADMQMQVTEGNPVVDNSNLSSADDPDSIAQDVDDAYIAQLKADLEADMRSIDSL